MEVTRGLYTEFKVVEIAGEDDYDFRSYDLGFLRADVALGLSGSSLTIWILDGSCSIRFSVVTKPSIPILSVIWPTMLVFDRSFTDIFLSNAAQVGKTLKIYIGKK